MLSWLLTKAITHFVNVPVKWTKAKRHLQPRVVPRAGFELAQLSCDPCTPHANLGQLLSVYVVYDRPLFAVVVDEALLDQWGVTFDDAYLQAVENARQTIKLKVKELEPHVYATVGAYSANLLLQPNLLKELPVLGDLVVWPMDALFISGSSYPGSLEKIWEIRHTEENPSEQVMDMPLVYRDGTWSELIPEGSNWQNRASRLLAQRYNSQKEPLQAALVKQSRATLVADALWLSEEEADANGFTMVVHGPEIGDQMLPRCDAVILMKGIADASQENRPEFAILTWDEFAQAMGDRLTPAGYFPVRYLASGCPEIPTDGKQLPERARELARKFFSR